MSSSSADLLCMQAVYDNHRQEFVMSRAKVNWRRLNMALEGLRRMQVHNCLHIRLVQS